MATYNIHKYRIIRNLAHIHCRGDLCIDGILFLFRGPTCTQSPAQAAGERLGSLCGANKPASAAGLELHFGEEEHGATSP